MTMIVASTSAIEAEISAARVASRVGLCPTPHVSNVVASFQLEVALDLSKIFLHLRNTHYTFPGKLREQLTMDLSHPKAKVHIYRTGKCMVLGAASIHAAQKAAELCTKRLQKTLVRQGLRDQDEPFNCLNFTVRNIVGGMNLPFTVDLESLSRVDGTSMYYEPEVFPGLTWKLLDPDVTVRVFRSGKIVFTKGTKPSHMQQAAQAIYTLLCKHSLT
eukprot:m.373581 g.373581  ORF g.373581 m.373581 type:complete len:217 (+) comp68524_c0_seq1:56-706(+)